MYPHDLAELLQIERKREFDRLNRDGWKYEPKPPPRDRRLNRFRARKS